MTSGDEELRAFRRAVQERARAVLVQLLQAQPRLSMPEQEVEPMAEPLRTGMAGLALWWTDHPEVQRPVLA